MRTPLPLTGCRVLLVEDDPADAHGYGTILAQAGATVTAAPDAEHAVALIGSGGPFNVLVIDLVLPGMRGTELVAVIKTGGFRGALVGISAHLTDEVVELWYAAGCDVVIPKDQGESLVATTAALCRTYGRS